MGSIECKWVVIGMKKDINFVGIAYIKIRKLPNYPLKIGIKTGKGTGQRLMEGLTSRGTSRGPTRVKTKSLDFGSRVCRKMHLRVVGGPTSRRSTARLHT